MRYPDEDITQVMGIGQYVGQVRQDSDGNTYQWVEGIDGLGNPVGFWKSLAKKALSLTPAGQALRLLPIAKKVARYTPTGRAVNYLLARKRRRRSVCPPCPRRYARRPAYKRGRYRFAGYDGIGALYQAPDGNLFQAVDDDAAMNGLAQDEELEGLGQDELTEIMGIGTLGEVRRGPDGDLYQWVQGVDGLGNPIGFWKRLTKFYRGAKKKIRKVVRRVAPLAQKFAPLIPGYGPAISAGLNKLLPILRQYGLANADGFGALYEDPNGTIYQVEGLADYEDMEGLADAEELEGFADDYEDMEGLADAEELEGFADDYEDMEGLGEEYEDMEGLGQGYVQNQDNIYGLEGYVPHRRPVTRRFKEPAQAPKIWEAPW